MMNYFPNRLMNDSRMETFNHDLPYHGMFEPETLTEEELLADCIEVDGLFYLIDENHSGFLFLTD